MNHPRVVGGAVCDARIEPRCPWSSRSQPRYRHTLELMNWCPYASWHCCNAIPTHQSLKILVTRILIGGMSTWIYTSVEMCVYMKRFGLDVESYNKLNRWTCNQKRSSGASRFDLPKSFANSSGRGGEPAGLNGKFGYQTLRSGEQTQCQIRLVSNIIVSRTHVEKSSVWRIELNIPFHVVLDVGCHFLQLIECLVYALQPLSINALHIS